MYVYHDENADFLYSLTILRRLPTDEDNFSSNEGHFIISFKEMYDFDLVAL